MNEANTLVPKPVLVRRSRRFWIFPALTLLGMTIATAGLWVWAQTEGSLSSAMRALAWALPATQQLQSAQVQGSLRSGGQLGHIHWRQAGLDVQITSAVVTLDWSRLMQGQLPVTDVQVQQLTIKDERAPKAPAPLTHLSLPLEADVPWQVAQLTWTGSSTLDLSDLQGRYRYDGQNHVLALKSLTLGQGLYHGQASLQGKAPMALDVQLHGNITAQAPGSKKPLALTAYAQLQGPLAGPSAALQLKAQVQPTSAKTSAMQLQLEATLHPWQAQVVSSVNAQAALVDLANLWPGAPRTLLSGQVKASPQALAQDVRWQMQGELSNALPGPWDQHKIPLHRLRLDIGQAGPDWQIHALDMAWPGGSAQAQGQWKPTGWSGSATIDHLPPGQLHSALNGPALSGTLQATQADAGVVKFEALLRPTGELKGAPKGAAPSVDSSSFMAHGQWTPQLWTFDQLELRLANALLQGHGQWTEATSSLTGQWTWAWPGLQGTLDGQLAAQGGQGQMQIDLQDAQRSLQWLQRWPQLKPHLQGWQAQGQAKASAQWHGGWQQADTRVQATLDAPRLQATSTVVSPWQWRLASAQVGGTLQSMQVKAKGQAQRSQGLAQFDVLGQLRHPAEQAWLSHWEGQLQQARLQWTSEQNTASLQLQSASDWQWVGAKGSLQWGTSTWNLLGPSPGQAQLQIEHGDWTPASGQLARAHLKAQVSNLPWQWAQALGAPEMQGDLLLKGALTLSLEDRLKLQARLERSRGQLLVTTEGVNAAPTDAGIQEAFAELSISGQDAQLQMLWRTERAGQLQALLHSRVDATDPAGLWPAQAPLSGRITAQLPRMGAWSWLAPPGWRVQGSLDAAVDVSGTRSQPKWSGLLQANNLAARSAVQGIEFSQGQLRAQLQDQKLVLEQFSLKGAGAQGGEVSAQGQLAWNTLNSQGTSLSDVQMDLQITARALRVSNRADRRLTVSGQMNGKMTKGQMQLTGNLKADQAQFILQDDTTPTLGEDVVVLQKESKATPTAKTNPRTLMGTPDIRVLLDLGPDFQVQGHGLSTRLAGQVMLVSQAASQGQPRLTGQVSTEGGRFKAYGQQLTIEQGLLRFTGPYDNPDLEILALRPNLSQRVGVTVTGTAQAPRIRLYADPDMADADKLAWLVLGRSPAGGGAESAVLQQAAVALLGGNGKRLGGDLANALGLDEISLANGSRSATTTSASTATGTAITLGKRLSKDFYLVYESSLSGAFGSLYVFYDLSRRLTLRAQAGDVNALDLVYTVRKD